MYLNLFYAEYFLGVTYLITNSDLVTSLNMIRHVSFKLKMV